MEDKCLKCIKLEAVIEAVDSNMGIYPQAMSGYNDERDYKERDGFKNGWNACVIEYGKQFRKAIVEAQIVTETDAVFLTSSLFHYQEGEWCVFLNDTWYYASADAEEIPKDKEKEVADLFQKHGEDGVLYWVYKQRGHYPSIPSTLKQVKRIEAMS